MIPRCKNVKIGYKQVSKMYYNRKLVWKKKTEPKTCSIKLYRDYRLQNCLDNFFSDGFDKAIIKDNGGGTYDVDIYTRPYKTDSYTTAYIELITIGNTTISYQGKKKTNAIFEFRNIKLNNNVKSNKELNNILNTEFKYTVAITDNSTKKTDSVPVYGGKSLYMALGDIV